MIVRNKEGKSRGYAFIEYEHKNDFKRAYKQSDARRIDGHKIMVDCERGRVVDKWLPKRLGGGKGDSRPISGEIKKLYEEKVRVRSRSRDKKEKKEKREKRKYSNDYRKDDHRKEEHRKDDHRKDDHKKDEHRKEDYRKRENGKEKDIELGEIDDIRYKRDRKDKREKKERKEKKEKKHK